MKTFISNNFLLENEFAKILYHEYAKGLPIIDYHNHLSADDIAKNRKFENISQVWLAGDHYKWRAMRTLGIEEIFITGDASDKEKFKKWAETVPYTLRNPLYHWTHLELLRYFGIDTLLTPKSAEYIYENTMSQLQQISHATKGLLQQQKVELLCTTDDPADNLENHKQIKTKSGLPKVIPTFRPDNAIAVEHPQNYLVYIQKLGAAIDGAILSYADLLNALEQRIAFFHSVGARLADHGLSKIPYSKQYFDCEKLFKKLKSAIPLTTDEVTFFKMKTLLFLSRCYHKYGWTQQFHLGPIRNNNTRLLKKLGADSGFDSIGDYSQAKTLSLFLNDLDSTDQLTKTILYNVNPTDNEVFATMAGNFNDGSIKGKIQYGSGWWFLDQKNGIEKQLNTLSNMGLLSCFVGMLTDSRSFLSFPRHEYFRRILCNLIGADVTAGQLPKDEKWLGKIVSDICYYNAKAYFNF